MERKNVFEVKNLQKRFGKNIVFENINFEIFQGDRVALIAKNGGGKTTICDIICGLQKPTKGKILFTDKKKFFEEFGIQFQGGEYPKGITVSDLIYLYQNISQIVFSENLIEKFKIKELKERKLNNLSYGQRKRVELFLLIASKSKFLVLDEVTNGMDIFVITDVMNFLKKYLKDNEITLIYISHNVSEINRLCNRMIFFDKAGVFYDEKIRENTNVEKKIGDLIFKNEKKANEKKQEKNEDN